LRLIRFYARYAHSATGTEQQAIVGLGGQPTRQELQDAKKEFPPTYFNAGPGLRQRPVHGGLPRVTPLPWAHRRKLSTRR